MCAHSRLEPSLVAKYCVRNSRSIDCSITAASSAANANSIIQAVSSHDQENIGRFHIPMPSARERCIVVRKFTVPIVIEKVNRTTPRIAAFPPAVASITEVYMGTFSGAYIVQPPENDPPWKNEITNKIPENR